MENERLLYVPDARETRANISDLSRFGFIGYAHQLTGGDPAKFDEFMNTPYSTVFSYREYGLATSMYYKRLSETK